METDKIYAAYFGNMFYRPHFHMYFIVTIFIIFIAVWFFFLWLSNINLLSRVSTIKICRIPFFSHFELGPIFSNFVVYVTQFRFPRLILIWNLTGEEPKGNSTLAMDSISLEMNLHSWFGDASIVYNSKFYVGSRTGYLVYLSGVKF